MTRSRRTRANMPAAGVVDEARLEHSDAGWSPSPMLVRGERPRRGVGRKRGVRRCMHLRERRRPVSGARVHAGRPRGGKAELALGESRGRLSIPARSSRSATAPASRRRRDRPQRRTRPFRTGNPGGRRSPVRRGREPSPRSRPRRVIEVGATRAVCRGFCAAGYAPLAVQSNRIRTLDPCKRF